MRFFLKCRENLFLIGIGLIIGAAVIGLYMWFIGDIAYGGFPLGKTFSIALMAIGILFFFCGKDPQEQEIINRSSG